MSTPLQNLFQKKLTRKDFIRATFVMFVSAFGVYGVVEQILSHASSPYSSTAASKGSLAKGAVLIKDPSSGDEVVQFEKAVTASPSPSPSPSASPSPTPTAGSLFVGVSMGYDPVLFNDSDSGLAQYKIMKADGFTSVRLECGYQASGTAYEDATIRAALSAGLGVLLILDGYDASSITAAEFASFCGRTVTTYAALGIHYYEILNEGNGNDNWNSDGSVNPAAYAALLKASYTAIKAADSKSVVIFTGMPVFSETNGASQGNGNYSGSLLPGTFLTLAYAAMGGNSTGYFDAMGAHPYCGGTPSSGNNWGVLMNPNGVASVFGDSLRTIMTNNGDSAKKIWITEFGIGSDSDSSDASYTTQANNYTTTFNLINSYNFVGAFYIFNWQDDTDDDTVDNPPQYWGLNNSSYVPKPALATVMANIKTLNTSA
jgi:hypothetical protein